MLQQLSINLGGSPDTEFNPQTRSVLFDDFAFEASNNSSNGPMGLNISGGNGGSASSVTAAPAAAFLNHVGVVPLSTGTTSNATGFVLLEAANSNTFPGACTSMTWEFCFYMPSLVSTGGVTYTLEFGFRSTSTTGRATNAVAILYDQAVSTNWAAYTSNNGSATTVTTADTNFQVNASQYYTAKIVMVSGLASFYIRSDTGAYGLIGTSSTNLPDSGHKAWISCISYKTGSVTTTATIFSADWMKLDTVVAR